MNTKDKLEVGDVLTVNHEIINIYTGAIMLEKGQPVTVSKVIMTDGYWSRLCPDIYIKPKLSAIRIEEHSGDWSPSTFIMPDWYNSKTHQRTITEAK